MIAPLRDTETMPSDRTGMESDQRRFRTFLAFTLEQGEFVTRPTFMIVTRVCLAATTSVGVLLLGGCGDVSGDVPPGGSAAPETVVQVYEDVEFYPACPVRQDGVRHQHC